MKWLSLTKEIAQDKVAIVADKVAIGACLVKEKRIGQKSVGFRVYTFLE